MSRSVELILLTLSAMLTPLLYAQSETLEQSERPAYTLRDEAEIESTLERLLSASEYRRLGREEPASDEPEASNLPGWLERFLDWLADWLSSLFPSSSDEGPETTLPNLAWLRWIVYTVVVVVVILVIALIVKAILERVSREEPAEASPSSTTSEEVASTPPGEHPSQEYLRRAMAAAETGDYKAAIRQLLLGTMSWIERHNLIRYRRGLSNRDYIRAVRSRPPLLDPLSKIVLHFERVTFGRRDATRQGFQECLQHFRKAFEAE